MGASNITRIGIGIAVAASAAAGGCVDGGISGTGGWGILDSVASWSSVEEEHTWSLAWGDVDGDGDLDLAVGTKNGSGVYENVDGSLSWLWSSAASTETLAVAWGDWDGDGDLDLAAGILNQANVLFENTEGALSTTPVWSSDEADMTRAIAWADMDGDGDLDLAVGNGTFSSPRVNRVYLNGTAQGSPGLETTASWTSPEADTTYAIAWGDWNADGYPELASGGYWQTSRVYENTTGSLSSAWILTSSGGPLGVDWGDWNADGYADLAIGDADGGADRVYQSTGSTLTLAWTSVETETTRALRWADSDGDGDLDLAAAHEHPSAGPGNPLYENTGTSLELSWRSDEFDASMDAAWGDVNGDGAPELVFGNRLVAGGEQDRIHDNTPSAPALDWTSTETDESAGLAWGDWDGDGDLDLAVGNGGVALANEPVRLYENTDGELSLVWTSPELEPSRELAWGDFDGDGDLDLAVANQLSQPNRLYENTGAGLVSYWTTPETDNHASVAWVDWDGDGDLDLSFVGGRSGAAPNRVYDNDAGVFTLAWTSPDLNWSSGQDWGDFDGDGDPDLAVANFATASNRLYRNDGGVLVLTWSSDEEDSSFSVEWGDADGDGDLDLAVGNDVSTANRVYLNAGSGLETTATWVSDEAESTIDVAWSDPDGDGDLDLLAVNWGTAPSRIYRNDGTALATSGGEQTLGGDHGTAAAWADVDSDGDVDLALGNEYDEPTRLYRNHRISDPLLPNNPTHPVVHSPGTSGVAAAGFYSAELLAGPLITVPFVLIDAESDAAPSIRVEYSLVGGGQWLLANLDGSDNPAPGPFAATPEGVAHTLVWNAADDVLGPARQDRVRLRVVVEWQNPTHIAYPIQHGAVAAVSPRFRLSLCDNDGDLSVCASDCDDADPAIHPGAPDLPDDGIDQDCNGLDTITCFEDLDGDGFGSPATVLEPDDGSCTDDLGQSAVDTDCDDGDSAIHPGASELCDALDNDCDGTIPADELDGDGDGTPECEGDCAPADPLVGPTAPEQCNGLDDTCDGLIPADEFDNDADGFAPCAGDCDNTNAAVHPDAPELCDDGLDNDCDGLATEDPAFVDVDGDGDGVTICDPAGHDCNDLAPTVSPLEVEVCDGLDNDCDGLLQPVELDLDGDGVRVCDGDCDDANPAVSPDLVEVCDGLDTDCDGVVPANEADADGDGYVPCGEVVPPLSNSKLAGDCDDADPTISPAVPVELCDGVDTDCDGILPPDESDADADGFRPCEGDCDDGASGVHPGATEVCDNVDQDCDGEVDEGLDVDADGDGFLHADSCADGDDCDDTEPSVHPGAEELCDLRDTDCTGSPGLDEQDRDDDGWVDCPDWVGTEDGILGGDDCKDLIPTIYPGAEELCDGEDTDCDGVKPEDEVDGDSDGSLPCQGDCDDDNATVRPGNPEVCDGVDSDCDGALPAHEADADGDGWFECNNDCDLDDPMVNPGVLLDVCDGIDDDCDGVVDEHDDADEDGVAPCVDPPDCDDSDARVRPGLPELCGDGLDNDCSGAADDAPECAATALPAPGVGVACSVGAGGSTWLMLLPLAFVRRRGR